MSNENTTYEGHDINIREYTDKVIIEDSTDYLEIWIRSSVDAKKVIEALQRLLINIGEGGQ